LNIAHIHFSLFDSTTCTQPTFGRPTLSGPQLVQVSHALVVALALTSKKYSMAFAVDLAVLRATGVPLLATSNHTLSSSTPLWVPLLPYPHSPLPTLSRGPVRYPRDNLPSIERELLSAD